MQEIEKRERKRERESINIINLNINRARERAAMQLEDFNIPSDREEGSDDDYWNILYKFLLK